MSFDLSASLEFTATFNDKTVNTFEESTEISYTLSDDDAGDQHSVTVVNGVSPRHTPYFYRFAGRSSCPPETGELIRDDPKIQILGGKKTISLLNQDPDEPVTVNLLVTNNSQFGEDREVSIFLNSASNPEGAFLTVAGQSLGTVDLGYLQAGVSQTVTLTINRNVAYRYDNLQIGVVATCGGLNQNKDYVDLSIQYETPCSPVTIVAPNNSWVVNGINDVLEVKARDYQPNNPVFNKLQLEYRRADTGDDWDLVTDNELSINLGQYETNLIDVGFMTPFSPSPSVDFLATYNDVFVGTPSFPFTWNIPEDPMKYPDGNYEIRVAAVCEGSFNYSNVVSGKISRGLLRLQRAPQPADGLWTQGNRLEAEFNQDLDCALLSILDNFEVAIIDKSNNDAPIENFHLVCGRQFLNIDFGENDNFQDDFAFMQALDGHRLEVIIHQATAAESGNQLTEEPIRWEFNVITQKLYWATDTIEVELYADEVLSIPVALIKTTGPEDNLPPVTLAAKDGQIDQDWLNIEVLNDNDLTFDPDTDGGIITFNIGYSNEVDYNTGQREVEEVIEINGLGVGNKPTIVVKGKILERPPNWVVNTSYIQTMNLNANWKFLKATETSVDSMDIISVWIDGTLRGVAQVEIVPESEFNYASLTIYGNEADKNQALEFRVWDADQGIEYLAELEDEILLFANNAIIGIGTVETPRTLLVDELQGQIRTIPLKKGWTGFSINSQNSDNSLTKILGSLTKLTTGDKILDRAGNQGKLAEYTEGLGWLTSNGATSLADLNPLKGYQIYLKNGPDTISLTGVDAVLLDLDLVNGWNWVGFPLQTASEADTFKFDPPLANGSALKTLNRIMPNGADIFLSYNGVNWSGDLKLKPYDFIKIKVDNAEGTTLKFKTDNFTSIDSKFNPQVATSRNSTPPDPTDPDTWILGEDSWEYQLPLIATLSFNGVLSENLNDRLAVFKDGELRGLGHIEHISAIDKYVVVISVGGITTGEIFQLYYYNATEDKVYEVNLDQPITLDLGEDNGGSLGYGKFSAPYPIEVALFSMTVVKQDVFCASDNTGSIEVTPVGAFAPTYLWSHDPAEKGNRVENLSAGTYTVSITDVQNIPVMKTIEIINQRDDIIVPTVVGAADPICLGESIALIASSESEGAEFKWFDAEGMELGAGNQLLLNNRQETAIIKVVTLINGVCQSDFTDVPIVVSSVGSASFEVSDRNPEINNQTVTFTPTTQIAGYMYAWDFGDGQTSMEMIAEHIFTAMGPFNVSLTIASPDNCEASSVSINVVSTHEPICGISFNLDGELPEGIHRQAENITSAGTVEAGKNVELRAGTSIVLSPGFHAKAASTFLAMIDPCTASLEQPAAPATERTAAVTTTTILPTIDELNLAPNPTSGSTKISFKLGEASKIYLEIYDPRGRLVRRLINGDFYPSGNHELTFLPDNLTYGIYHIVLKNEQKLITKKLIIVR